jgi:serine/threonine protein kinase
VAVKVVNLAKVREKGVEEMLKREIKLLRELSHRNVIACRDVLMTANNCYIVTEFCPQGDLAALLAKKGTPPLMQAGCPKRKRFRCCWTFAED